VVTDWVASTHRHTRLLTLGAALAPPYLIRWSPGQTRLLYNALGSVRTREEGVSLDAGFRAAVLPV